MFPIFPVDASIQPAGSSDEPEYTLACVFLAYDPALNNGCEYLTLRANGQSEYSIYSQRLGRTLRGDITR